MRATALHGKLVGTFDGRAGDQFSLGESKIDVLVGGSYDDPETGERFVELVFRANQPVDEQRIHVEIPDHGIDNLVSMIEEARQE